MTGCCGCWGSPGGPVGRPRPWTTQPHCDMFLPEQQGYFLFRKNPQAA